MLLKPIIIPSTEGISLSGKAFPSYVAIKANGEKLVGESARRQAAENPEGTITAFKRKMGKREMLHLRDKAFTPEQLSAFLLQKIKNDAEAFLEEVVKLHVPQGVQHDTILHISKKGLPYLGNTKRGDLYVRINLYVPEKISDKEHLLYERLRSLAKEVNI